MYYSIYIYRQTRVWWRERYHSELLICTLWPNFCCSKLWYFKQKKVFIDHMFHTLLNHHIEEMPCSVYEVTFHAAELEPIRSDRTKPDFCQFDVKNEPAGFRPDKFWSWPDWTGWKKSVRFQLCHAVLYLSVTVLSHAYCYNFVSCSVLSLLVLPNSLLYRNDGCSCSINPLFSFFLCKEHVPIEIVSPLIMIDESVVQSRLSTRIQTEQSLFRKTGCCYHDESCKQKTCRIKHNFHRWIMNYISLKQPSTAIFFFFWFGMIINLILNVIDYLIGHENIICKATKINNQSDVKHDHNYSVRLFTYRWNEIETVVWSRIFISFFITSPQERKCCYTLGSNFVLLNLWIHRMYRWEYLDQQSHCISDYM